jgi:molecular chaperone GrpE
MSDEENKVNPIEEAVEPVVAAASTEEDVESRLKEAEAKRDEYLAGWQRAKADFINFKKDEHTRLAEAIQYATTNIVSDILHVLDALDLGLASAGEKESKGLTLIRAQLLDALKRYGLEKISVNMGERFDPNFHEAMMVEERDGPEDVVLQELVPGYRLRERVIRPVKVKVSKSTKEQK